MRSLIILATALLILTAGCAAVQPVNPGAPSRNQPVYPALLSEAPARIDAANAVWQQLTAQQGVGSKIQVPLQPITSTIQNLPSNFNGPLYLPKVGASNQMSEEETRESLRRFLNEWKTLLGVEPAQLALVNDSIGLDGTRVVNYDQRPFTYPLVGPYGKVEIRFAPDRRILAVTSSGIPDAAKLQAVLNGAATQVRSLDTNAKLKGHAVSYSDANGLHAFTIEPPIQPTVQQLIIYPRPAANAPGTLEFHLVWEIALTNAPVSVVYFDVLQDVIFVPLPDVRQAAGLSWVQ
ncbi:MAG TPA: hypothetical protein VN643_03175 [Pyrinomonadaceae bacterium]|nr:hypothetical protein [Pyrinomonadaceae bacterium]